MVVALNLTEVVFIIILLLDYLALIGHFAVLGLNVSRKNLVLLHLMVL